MSAAGAISVREIARALNSAYELAWAIQGKLKDAGYAVISSPADVGEGVRVEILHRASGSTVARFEGVSVPIALITNANTIARLLEGA